MKKSKKADVTSPIIMWLGVLTAALILGSWLITQVRPVQRDIEVLSEDLEILRTSMDRACTSIHFFKKYNPRTETGEISINETHTCINSTNLIDCFDNPCVPSENFRADLKNLTYVIIDKEFYLNFYTDLTYQGDENPPALPEISVEPETGNASTLFNLRAVAYDRSEVSWLAFAIAGSGIDLINITESLNEYDHEYGPLPVGIYSLSVIASDKKGNRVETHAGIFTVS